MTTAAAHATPTDERPLLPTTAVPVPRYRAERLHSLEVFLARVAALAGPASLPFHNVHWLRAWYATLGQLPGCEPWLVAVQGASSPGLPAGDLALLPLVMRRHHGHAELGFADAGLVDYVGPILHPEWACQATPTAAGRALWRALRPLLAGADVLRLDKLLPHTMPEAGSTPNPLACALTLQDSDLFGNQFEVPGEWEDWRRSLDKRVRKEIERSWRVFERSPVARLERITEPARAAQLLGALELQQAQRLRAMGADYRLAEPAFEAFYRQLLAAGLADGSVVLTALLDGDDVVSVLFGVANGARYIGLRQSLGGDAWKACSPGRLLDEGTARLMHAAGGRYFDFGVGDYFHKSTLNMVHIPLLQGCVALSWRGWPVVLAWRLKRWARHQPQLMTWWRRWHHPPNP